MYEIVMYKVDDQKISKQNEESLEIKTPNVVLHGKGHFNNLKRCSNEESTFYSDQREYLIAKLVCVLVPTVILSDYHNFVVLLKSVATFIITWLQSKTCEIFVCPVASFK